MVELQQLCDKVPSYDSDLAFRILCSELGVSDVSEVFSEITPEPVAAASLGQVYKARLEGNAWRDGGFTLGIGMTDCTTFPGWARGRDRTGIG